MLKTLIEGLSKSTANTMVYGNASHLSTNNKPWETHTYLCPDEETQKHTDNGCALMERMMTWWRNVITQYLQRLLPGKTESNYVLLQKW